MNAVTLTAVAKHVSVMLKAMDGVTPGVHPVDATLTISVSGTVQKGEDVEYTPTVDIPLLATLALVMEKSGFQRERSKALLIEAMTEALVANDATAPAVAERVRDIEAAMVHVREVTAALPRKIRTGPTNVKVNGEVVEAVPVPA